MMSKLKYEGKKAWLSRKMVLPIIITCSFVMKAVTVFNHVSVIMDFMISALLTNIFLDDFKG